MRVVLFFLIVFVLFSCDADRVYEKNYDFDDREWLITNQPSFEFSISDTTQAYNLYCNVRNSVSYPYSRIFINYSVQDSTGVSIKKDLISTFLFEEKTGKPLGDSGLGDIYDQQVMLLKKYSFQKPGTYAIKFEQFMRTDTLSGILAVGFRLEKALPTE